MFAQITAFFWWAAFTPWIANTAINTATVLGIVGGTYLVADIVLSICD